ncbi:ABC transporter permease [Macrococcoides canis]|uniref:Transport permease protein n=2 Tax=Macrococcoides canis TaxID=1855823 RepID=A0AAE6X0I4_9STAP|nr:ABC transporter permease [Macrococcus canis]QNR07076.1 ABC transporter permease [Macrococcus canis]TDM22781.1 ABC transporter permease [Macrococcus canis]UTH09626.1 ABC transporter permease [Macrococcus canis]
MMEMKKFKALFRYEMIDIYNRKSMFIMSVALPVIFFLIFSSMMSGSETEISYYTRDYMLSMTTFSLTSYAIFSFPIELINEKKQGWTRSLLRTPITPLTYYSVKVLKMIIMYMISILLVFIIGGTIKNVEMSVMEWIISYLALLFGAIIFLSIGLLLSQYKDAQKVSTIGNILYLGLAMLGGLWFPIAIFPEWLKPIAKATPTYNLKNLAAGVFNDNYPYESILILGIYGFIFVILSLWIRKKVDVM